MAGAGVGAELDAIAAALTPTVAEAVMPRIERAIAAAVEVAVSRQPSWSIMPGTIDPDSQAGSTCAVEPDDTPGEFIEAIRLDPRQGVPDTGCDGDRLRTLILRVPPAAVFCLGIIPDDPLDEDDARPTLAIPASVADSSTNTFNSTATGFGITTTGGTYDDVGVAFVAACTGRALVSINGFLRNATAGQGTMLGVVIREGDVVGSGTVFQAAADIDALQQNGTGSNTDGGRAGCLVLVEGLTPGEVYNARLEHRVSGGTSTITRRSIIVSPDLGVALP